jgi:hypothetical protein
MRNYVAKNGLKIYKIQKRVLDFYSKMFMVVSNSYGLMKRSIIYFSFVNLHIALKCVHFQTQKYCLEMTSIQIMAHNIST